MPFVIFLVYLMIEIALFIWIGGMIGVGWTLLWVLAGFVIGVWMLRRGGSKSREWLQNASAGVRQPHAGRQIYWYIGGLLVILPGFFTDALGLLLVFPPTQAFVTWLISLFIPETLQTGWTVVSNFSQTTRTDDADVIDVEAEEIMPEELPKQ